MKLGNHREQPRCSCADRGGLGEKAHPFNPRTGACGSAAPAPRSALPKQLLPIVLPAGIAFGLVLLRLLVRHGEGMCNYINHASAPQLSLQVFSLPLLCCLPAFLSRPPMSLCRVGKRTPGGTFQLSQRAKNPRFCGAVLALPEENRCFSSPAGTVFRPEPQDSLVWESLETERSLSKASTRPRCHPTDLEAGEKTRIWEFYTAPLLAGMCPELRCPPAWQCQGAAEPAGSSRLSPNQRGLRDLKALDPPPPTLWSEIRACLSSRFTPEGANFNLLQGLVILFSETHPIACEASPEIPGRES